MSNIVQLNVPVKRSRTNQLFKLVQRRLLTFYRDKRDLSITFGQAPILAIAFFFVFQNIVTALGKVESWFQPLRDYLTTDTVSIIVFLAVLTSIWFGSSKAIVEIPRSKILYQQERLSFLDNFNYIISIFITLSIIVLGQVLLFSVTFYSLFVFLPTWFQPYGTGLVVSSSESVSFLTALMPLLLLKFVLLMWLIAVASISVAMFISMFTSSQAAANAILSFLLIIQILFAGSVIKPVINMTPAIQAFSNIIVSRWGFEAIVLLFERDLNMSMLRRDNDTIFAAFHFTKGLRKVNAKDYLTQIKNRDLEYLINSPSTIKTLRSAIEEAANGLLMKSEFSDSETDKLTKAESDYINKLQKAKWNIKEFSNEVMPERLLQNTLKQFYSLYPKYIRGIISIVDQGDYLTEDESQFWNSVISVDQNLNIFRRSNAITFDVETDKKIKMVIDTQIIWMILFFLTFGILILGWIYFSIKNP